MFHSHSKLNISQAEFISYTLKPAFPSLSHTNEGPASSFSWHHSRRVPAFSSGHTPVSISVASTQGPSSSLPPFLHPLLSSPLLSDVGGSPDPGHTTTGRPLSSDCITVLKLLFSFAISSPDLSFGPMQLPMTFRGE